MDLLQEFKEKLTARFAPFRNTLASEAGDWTVKGFIDIRQNIYTISIDTKVISKIVELMLFPIIAQFAEEEGYRMILCQHQNHYPDITFVLPDERLVAIDFKSTYRKNGELVNGFTLGAFTGYFRSRNSDKNVTFPYGRYSAHFVLGIIYSRMDDIADERRRYTLAELPNIASVVRDFTFVLQEKWRIADTRPGSGNTKNIGSVTSINALVDGLGPFSGLGLEVFDDYWMNYMTGDMARAIDSPVPYHNLDTYFAWRGR